MSEELTTYTPNQEDFVGEIMEGNLGSYCSMKIETKEDKAKLFRIMNNPEYKVADVINTPIKLKDVYLEAIQVTNEETGEVSVQPRMVLIDADGQGYQSVSRSLFSSLKKLIAVFGQPTWEDGIDVKVLQLRKGSKVMYTLEVL